MGKAHIICGSPGAGKSTYGKRLAAKIRAAFIDIDTATERLVRLSLLESGHDMNDRDSPYFKTTYRQVIYDAMFDIAIENLPHIDVVIAGPFTREIRDPLWPGFLENHLKSTVEIHYVYCEPEIRRKRLLERANDRDRLKFEDWDAFNRYYGQENPPDFKCVLFDNTYPFTGLK